MSQLFNVNNMMVRLSDRNVQIRAGIYYKRVEGCGWGNCVFVEFDEYIVAGEYDS